MTFLNEHPAQGQSRLQRASSVIAEHYGTVALVLLVTHATVAWLARAPGILLGHNDAMYVVLGESLRGFTYREMWYANTPPHAMYPPVYPAVLGILQAINGDGFNWLVSANVLASTLALALLFDVVRKWRGAATGLLCLAALAFNPPVVRAAGTLGAETQMILAIALVLWALMHEERGSHMSVVAAGGAIAAALLRTAAVPLLVTVFLYWVFQRRYRKAAIFSAACLLTVGSWLLWSAVVPNQAPGRSYIADAIVLSDENRSVLQHLALRIAGHVARYAAIVYWSLPMPTVRGVALDNWIGVSLAFSALGIGLTAMVKTWRPAALFVVLYGALLAVWPYVEDRFLVPAVPLLVIGAVVGSTILAQLRTPRVPFVGGIVLLLIVLTGVVSTSTAVVEALGCERREPVPSSACLAPGEAGFFEAVQYVRVHTSPDAVFLSAKPATLYYYTGRRSVNRELPVRQPAHVFLPLLREQGAQYLMLGGAEFIERKWYAPLIRANCDSLELAASIRKEIHIFRIPDGPQRRNDGDACNAIEEYYRAGSP